MKSRGKKYFRESECVRERGAVGLERGSCQPWEVAGGYRWWPTAIGEGRGERGGERIWRG